MTEREQTFADDLAQEDELLRRRFVHATRPRGPLSMDQAAELCERMNDDPAVRPSRAKKDEKGQAS